MTLWQRGLVWADQAGAPKTGNQAWIAVIVIAIVIVIGAVFSYRDQRIRNLEQDLVKKNEALQRSEQKYRSLVESQTRGGFQRGRNPHPDSGRP